MSESKLHREGVQLLADKIARMIDTGFTLPLAYRSNCIHGAHTIDDMLAPWRVSTTLHVVAEGVIAGRRVDVLVCDDGAPVMALEVVVTNWPEVAHLDDLNVPWAIFKLYAALGIQTLDKYPIFADRLKGWDVEPCPHKKIEETEKRQRTSRRRTTKVVPWKPPLTVGRDIAREEKPPSVSGQGNGTDWDIRREGRSIFVKRYTRTS